MSRTEIKDSVEDLKARIIHGNVQRYERSIAAIFTGQIILMLTAWFLLSIPSIDIIIPVERLRWLVGIAFFISVICLIIVFKWKKLHLATSIMAISHSLLFIPTLMCTGGFISPFSILYLLTMLLSVILVDVVPPVIGKISSAIVIIGYVCVSLSQLAGYQPVIIPYVQPLLEHKPFFWLIFTTVSLCFVNGFIAISSSSRNIRDTLTQLILTYRYVAKGTSLFTGSNFFGGLLKSLKSAIQVKTTWLIEWTNARQPGIVSQKNGRMIVDSLKGFEEHEIVISDEFKNAVERCVFENNHSLKPLQQYLNQCFSFEYTPEFSHWSPVYDSSGKIAGILGAADPKINTAQQMLVSDVMQIFASRVCAEFARRFEEQRRLEMQALLSQGQKMQAIGQLSSSIAHDFNNILNGIFGFASLISRNTESNATEHKYAEKIINLGKNAGGLISQLLVYSRKTKTSTANIKLYKVIEECIEIVRYTNKKKILIVKDLPTFTVSIDGDGSMIQSAVLNLLINACDAIEQEGNVSIGLNVIEITSERQNDFISGKTIPSGSFAVIIVEDNGCGIPEEKLIRIFEPFYTTKGVGRGTGLGLAAVFGCMESHSGYIKVDSTIGKGSVFRLYFPITSANIKNEDTLSENECEKLPDENELVLVKSQDENPVSDNMVLISKNSQSSISVIEECNTTESLSERVVTTDSELSSDVSKSQLPGSTESHRERWRTIMIVDDELSILESLSEYLSSACFNVICCDCGSAALQSLQQNVSIIETVIMDMVLPDISGKELFIMMRKLKSELDIIIITGYSSAEDLEYVKNSGASMVFYKPFEFKELEKVLHAKVAFDKGKDE